MCYLIVLRISRGHNKKIVYNTKFLKMYIKAIGPRTQVQRRWVGDSRNRRENKQTKNTKPYSWMRVQWLEQVVKLANILNDYSHSSEG